MNPYFVHTVISYTYVVAMKFPSMLRFNKTETTTTTTTSVLICHQLPVNIYLLKDDEETQQKCYILQLPNELQLLDDGIREKSCDSFHPYICRRIGSE